MRDSTRRSTPATHLVLRGLALAAPAAVLAAAVWSIDPGSQLETSLKSAAAHEAIRLAGEPAPANTRTAAAPAIEENSEAFWLTRAPEPESVARVAWSAPVAAGDRIVVHYGAYDRHVLDVVAVEAAGAATTRIETETSSDPRYVLTCRKADAPAAPLIRLTVDAGGRGITAIGTGSRSL